MSRLDFLYRTELPHRAVAVYIYLADRTNENNECWPAIPTIATDLKLSPSTVRRGIRDLKKAGLLETEQRYRKKGGKSSLLFRLRAEWKKQNAPPRGNCAYTLTGATCHGGRWKWTTQLKIDYSRKKKTQRFLFEKFGDNKDIFISTVLIVETIRYFLSAVRTFLWDHIAIWFSSIFLEQFLNSTQFYVVLYLTD